MKTIHIVSLRYDITFNDADDGRCYAGEGQRLLRVFEDADLAARFRDEVNAILPAAEGETTVFPVQSYNRKLRALVGFTLHDIGQGEENFRAVSESHEVAL